MKKSILLIALFIYGVTVAIAQNSLQRVKIALSSSRAGASDIVSKLEIDHYVIDDGYLISEITEQAVRQLKASGLKYQVLTENVGRELDSLNAAYYSGRTDPSSGRVALEQGCKTLTSFIAAPAAFEVKPTFGGYYSYAEMVTAIDSLVAAYPALAQKVSVGITAESRTIWAVKISDNVTTDETNEPELLYLGLQHAREAIGGSSMIFLMQYLCENYSTDQRITDLVNNREFFIIPCSNPDGWEYNRSTNPNGGGGWRKNRRLITGSTFGVDLNRNWGVDWGNCSAPIQGSPSSCGSGTPSSDTYYGSNAFSEPETQALRTFVTSHQFIAAIDQHCFGPYYSLPFGRSSLHNFSSTLGTNTLDSIFYNKTSALMGKYNGMRAGNSFQSVGYEVAGGFKDWMLLGDIGTGSKVKAYGLTGEGGAGGGTGGSFGSFWAPAGQIVNLCKGMTYQNLQLAFVAGSYIDLQDVTDIAVTSLSGTMDFSLRRVGLQNDSVTITLIPIQNLLSAGSPVTTSLVNYNDVFNGSVSYTLPPALANGKVVKFAWKIETGGQTYYDTVTKIYNPVQLFFDNMEGASVTTNWTVSGGWNYTTASAFQGSKSLAESPGGNYSSSSTRTATSKILLNLSDATAAYLSLWIRHRAENFRDKLQLQVSTNGSTWVAVCGKTTVQEAGTLDGSTINGQPSFTGIQQDWTREFFDLSAYNGQASLRFRLVFSSNASGSGFAFEVDDGFYIDNLKIIKSTTTPPAFTSLGSGAEIVAGNRQATFYPNPVSKELIVQMSTGLSEVAFVQLTDLQGRVLAVQNIPVSKTSSGQIKINTQYLNPGMYFVHLVNTRYQTVATQKIIKQ
ncbi:T9SS type A sorting domain-containing protein [Pseudoflavitalea sp. X16]|uniref:M14 family zinc carboxypeptidase n=1 Tax=Paraflavitalea devenefica TaxID=2716334 RepID=UPI001421D7B0|nr:M14 family zinc carboxypeptidase [Paraflavitalea devenefica]NII29210.1 T9SS type A sorting domain-containing protein [Paraflavitalea devenefica]